MDQTGHTAQARSNINEITYLRKVIEILQSVD